MTNLPMQRRIFAHAHRAARIGENRIMLMAQATKEWTRGDLARLPDDGNKYEVVRGELFVTPAPRSPHQQLIAMLNRLLVPYVASEGIGLVHQARSVVVFDGSEVEPDLFVQPTVSAPPPRWENAPTPLLVVEVLSPVTKRRDRGSKRQLYLDAGVPEYWIVDGERRSVMVVRPGAEDARVTGTLTWTPDGARTPFTLDLPAFFTDVLG